MARKPKMNEDHKPSEETQEDPMADENNTPTPAPTPAPAAAPAAAALEPAAEKLTAAEKRAAEAEAVAKQAQERADKALATIRDSFRSRELTGALHPDIVSLAPALELDDNLQPTEASLAALRKWRADRATLFAAANAGAAPAPVNPNLNTPAPGSQVPGELTKAEIERVYREDRKLYMTQGFQARMMDALKKGALK